MEHNILRDSIKKVRAKQTTCRPMYRGFLYSQLQKCILDMYVFKLGLLHQKSCHHTWLVFDLALNYPYRKPIQDRLKLKQHGQGDYIARYADCLLDIQLDTSQEQKFKWHCHKSGTAHIVHGTTISAFLILMYSSLLKVFKPLHRFPNSFTWKLDSYRN